jgi:hypothetical protein
MNGLLLGDVLAASCLFYSLTPSFSLHATCHLHKTFLFHEMALEGLTRKPTINEMHVSNGSICMTQ